MVELDELFGFGLRFPLTSWAEINTASRVLSVLQAGYTDGGAPDVGLQALLMNLPISDDPAAQPPALVIRGVFKGTQAQARATLGPLLAHVTDEAQQIVIWQQGRYLHLNEILLQTADPPGIDMPAVSMNTRPLVDCRIIAHHHDPERWREIITLILAAPDKTSFISMECYGGAINEIAPDATAFVHRTDSLDMFAWSFWTFEDNREDATAWLDEFGQIAEGMGAGRRYQNYVRPGNTDFGTAYFGANLERLISLKRFYDPDGLFEYEQNLLRCEGA